MSWTTTGQTFFIYLHALRSSLWLFNELWGQVEHFDRKSNLSSAAVWTKQSMHTSDQRCVLLFGYYIQSVEYYILSLCCCTKLK